MYTYFNESDIFFREEDWNMSANNSKVSFNLNDFKELNEQIKKALDEVGEEIENNGDE